MAKNNMDVYKTLRCSFCGKLQDQVSRMVAGPGVCICSECIELCQSVLQEENVAVVKKRKIAKKEIILPTTIELKKYLDEYVIGQDKAKKILSVAVYNHYKRINKAPNVGEIEIQKSNVFVAWANRSWKITFSSNFG